MSVVVSRSARVKSRISSMALVVMLLASAFMLCFVFSVRRIRSEVSSYPRVDDIKVVVLETMDAWAASNGFFIAQNLDFQDVPRGTSQFSSISPGNSPGNVLRPRVVPVSSFATWPSRTGYRARVEGVDCGVGDYIAYGLVLSIRPGRIICRDGDDFVILCLCHTSSPPPASVSLGAGDGGGEGSAPPLG